MAPENLEARLCVLAEHLVSQTKAGRINWTTTDDEESFLYVGKNASILVGYFSDGDGDDGDYRMSLLNSRGTSVITLATEWEPMSPDSNVLVASPEIVPELHEVAKRDALGIDELIKSIEADIDAGFTGKPFRGFDDEPPF